MWERDVQYLNNLEMENLDNLPLRKQRKLQNRLVLMIRIYHQFFSRAEQGCIISSILPSGMRARQTKNAPLEPSWVTSWVFDQFGENPHWTVTNLKPTKQRRDQNHHHVKENRVKKGAEYWKREIDWSLAKKNCIEDETNSGTTTPSLSSSWCLPIWSPSPPCEYLTGV